MVTQSDVERNVSRWFRNEHYDDVRSFSANDWAAQIYRRCMIRQSVNFLRESPDDKQRNDRVASRIQKLKDRPLDVPTWVSNAYYERESGPVIHPLRFGDLRNMLGYWRDLYGDFEPDQFSGPSGEYKPVDVDSLSAQLVWNGIDGEDEIYCDSVFANPSYWDAPGQVYVAIDLFAQPETISSQLQAYLKKVQHKYYEQARLPRGCANFSNPHSHPWKENRVLECFDIDISCEFDGQTTPNNGELLRLLNDGGNLGRAQTIRDWKGETFTFNIWLALQYHLKEN